MSPEPRPQDASSASTVDPVTPIAGKHSWASDEAQSEHARETVRARLRRELADLDYVRALHRWAATGTSQRDIARQLRMSQPNVSKALARRADTAQPLPGFTGSTPLELCQRYAAGWLTREALIAQLVAFPYTPKPTLTGWEDPLVLPPGTWADVEEAHERGLIDINIYDEVHTQRRADRTGKTAHRSLTGEPVEPRGRSGEVGASHALVEGEVAARASAPAPAPGSAPGTTKGAQSW